ncbi:TRAP transporter substrate-binding protein [Marispirochaeta sp.]|uniref:TRAP transporter substrate-binding protein n=1 Tax=Marispirochaeta sp. TaxID=2038653 RepID=UPI0029C93A7B|nr:TRAP transporter substrate-binding protein [Marispirochaeta sp.]
MKKLFVVLLVALLSIGLFANGTQETASTPTSENPLVLKLAENQPENNPVTIAMYKFADLVEEKTSGAVQIEVYASAQLGQETENIEQVSAGILEMARVNSVTLAQTVKELGVFTLPYIFTDQKTKYEILDGSIGKEVLDSFEQYNMVSFGYLEAGSRNFYTTKKPITNLSDLKGQKIRVQPAKISIDMVNYLGAVATPMDYGEVYTGLQAGVIDGAENDFVSYYTSGHYEVAKYFTLDAHLAPPAMIIMSLKSWNRLTDEQKAAVQKAADEATAYQRVAMNEKQDEFRALVEKAGTTVYDVNTKPFQDAVAPIYDEYPEFSDIINRIRSF